MLGFLPAEGKYLISRSFFLSFHFLFVGDSVVVL